MITRAYERGPRRPRRPDPQVGRALHHPPGGGGQDRGRARASTTSPSPPPCCTTRSRTPASPWPTSSGEFGADVAAIVDGVTKLDRLKFDSKEAQQAATMRKMLVAMAKDLRVLIIKLSDRLHNMRTHRGHAGVEAGAHRPGDARHLRPAGPPPRHAGDEAAARGPVPSPRCTRSATPRSTTWWPPASPEREHLPDPGARGRARAAGRAAHRRRGHRSAEAPLEHLREDGRARGSEFDEIFDLVGIRVVVDSVKDCYAALGSIHATWKPVQGRFKDYVAMPKFNLYQSLHTTVVGPQGKPLEVQIRTARDAQPGRVRRRRPLGLQGRPHLDGRPGLAQPHRRLAAGDRATPASSWPT